MNKFFFVVLPLALLSLSACSSSSPIVSSILLSAGNKLAIPTLTPYPTYTPFPIHPYQRKSISGIVFQIRLFPGIEASLLYASEAGTEFWLDCPKDANSTARQEL